MDIQQIRAVIEELTSLMDAKKLEELEIDVEGVKVHLRRAGRPPEPQAIVVAPSAQPVAPVAAAAPDAAPAVSEAETGYVVKSPMVGTLYRSPAPDADPFIEVGDAVTFDTVLCIIEAMKVMNELKAEVEGTLVAIRVENGEAVEYGQPLFVVAPKAS